MSTVSYRVVLEAGPYSWIVTSGDAATLGLADGLILKRGMGEPTLYPAHPEPAEVRFAVIAESWADYASLDVGHLVKLDVYFPADAADPAERFWGVVSDLSIVPVFRRGQHLTRIEVVAIDLISETDALASVVVPEPAVFDSIGDLVDGLFDVLGLPHPARKPLAGVAGTGVPAGDTDSGSSFSEAMQTYLGQWVTHYAIGGSDVLARYILALDLAASRVALLPVPNLTGLKAITDTYGGMFSIDADQVDIVGAFTRNKADAVQAVDVTSTAVDVGGAPMVATVGNPTATLRAAVRTTLPFTDDLEDVGALYLPNPDEIGWRVDAFTWRLKAAAPGSYLPIPNPNIPGSAIGNLLVSIDSIAPGWSPTGSTYRGALVGYTLTLAQARPTVELQLRGAVQEP